MKLKEGIELSVLLEYGFQKINKQEEEDDDNYTIANFDYKFEIGHSRRGQFYYLLVSEKGRSINIFASKPDGDGTSIGLPDVLIQLIKNDLLEPYSITPP